MNLFLKGSLVVILVACMAAVVLRRTRGSSASPELTGTVTSEKGELSALEALRKAGTDLSKPTEVSYFLVFTDSASAGRAADSVRASSKFETEILASRGRMEWVCLASATMVPEQSAILETTKRFKALAASFGGRFDRWEAEVAQ